MSEYIEEELNEDKLEVCPVCGDTECDCAEKETMELSSSEELLVLQEYQKEAVRLERLEEPLDFDSYTEEMVAAQNDACAIGVFFRTLIECGLSTAEAYNMCLQRQVIEGNVKQAERGSL